MKAKVTKCSRGTYWYANAIGEVFEVSPASGFEDKYLLVGEQKYFDVGDVEIMEEVEMKNTPHKHVQVIKAWADGAKIQYNTPRGWVDWLGDNSPSWDACSNYRVKPVPKPVYPSWPSGISGYYSGSDLLKDFVLSGSLAKYVEQYGVDGLKGQL